VAQTDAATDPRFAYHPPTSDRIGALHSYVRARHASLAHDLERDLPACRERSLALTKLEESMMWANAAIARVLNYQDDDAARPTVPHAEFAAFTHASDEDAA
jgi:hypothetical protein